MPRQLSASNKPEIWQVWLITDFGTRLWFNSFKAFRTHDSWISQRMSERHANMPLCTPAATSGTQSGHFTLLRCLACECAHTWSSPHPTPTWHPLAWSSVIPSCTWFTRQSPHVTHVPMHLHGQLRPQLLSPSSFSRHHVRIGTSAQVGQPNISTTSTWRLISFESHSNHVRPFFRELATSTFPSTQWPLRRAEQASWKHRKGAGKPLRTAHVHAQPGWLGEYHTVDHAKTLQARGVHSWGSFTRQVFWNEWSVSHVLGLGSVLHQRKFSCSLATGHQAAALWARLIC